MKIIKPSVWLFVAMVIGGCQKEDKIFYTGCCLNEPVAGSVGNTRIFLPTIFTPNDDGVNDYLYVISDSALKVVLFEIRGKKDKVVFQAQDIPANDYAKGWDGKVNGNVVRGLYAVTLEVEASDGTIREYESTVCNYPCGQSDELASISNCHYASQWYSWHFEDGGWIDPLPECDE